MNVGSPDRFCVSIKYASEASKNLSGTPRHDKFVEGAIAFTKAWKTTSESTTELELVGRL